MPGPVPFRYLPAMLLLMTLTATAQSLLARDENSTETAAAVANADADVPSSDLNFEAPPTPKLSPLEMGDIYMARKRYMAAIRAYSEIHNPTADVWNKLGIAYQQMFATKESMRCYKEAIKRAPKEAKYLNNLATLQDGVKDFGAAERNYRKSLKLDPTSAIVYKNLGTNLLMQHQYDKGHAAYRKALALDASVFDDHGGPKVNDPAPVEERGTAAYFKARSCARAGLNDCAISFLLRAFNEGAATVKKVVEEADFAGMMRTPAMTRLLANQQ